MILHLYDLNVLRPSGRLSLSLKSRQMKKGLALFEAYLDDLNTASRAISYREADILALLSVIFLS